MTEPAARTSITKTTAAHAAWLGDDSQAIRHDNGAPHRPMGKPS